MKVKIQCEDIKTIETLTSFLTDKKVSFKRSSIDEVIFEKLFRRKNEQALFDCLDYLHESGFNYNVILVGDL